MNSENDKPVSIQPLQTVWVRRGDAPTRQIPAKMLIPNIKIGKLYGSDEISGDGLRWVRLDRHSQLAHYFLVEEDSSPIEKSKVQLGELADMLKEING
ncbi:MAG: hypothetical protein G3M78_09600 [Candidatus Nitrohelix vancouverensis]|uniref:Uncharacterized protein n=1 Tax=Candidatus Nitrohelix vancouverensis TaxID=2705534 RepID=A0A7T0C344_9BACT|nr:MAG: hypothetical protein G3M78_09600 [Candidatus Nitrohelix vancouverensis]